MMMLDLQKISHGQLKHRLPVKSSRAYSYGLEASQELSVPEKVFMKPSVSVAALSHAREESPAFRIGEALKQNDRVWILGLLGCAVLFICFFYFIFRGRGAETARLTSSAPTLLAETPRLSQVSTARHEMTMKAPCLLTVFATEDVWLRVSLAGNILFEGILARGMKEEWKVSTTATIRIGAPQSLKFAVDGRDVPVSFWGTTKPVSLSFTQSGYSLLPLARAGK